MWEFSVQMMDPTQYGYLSLDRIVQEKLCENVDDRWEV